MYITVLDIKVYYYLRNVIIFHEAAAKWNITILREVINLITNTVKVQYLYQNIKIYITGPDQ